MWHYSPEKQRQHRESGNMTLAKFANKAGLPAETIANIERGNWPSIKTYLTIINALGLEPGFFLNTNVI